MSTMIRGLSREEVAARVCHALACAGIPVVLSGGAVVSIYCEDEYESFDLDFVRIGVARKVDGVMTELGYRQEGRYWTHPETPFWVEFAPGPVQVGDSVVTEFAERRTAVGVLRLLAATECVMDRLAGYYHWDDPQCLEQAVAVARRHAIDVSRVKAWSEREGSLRKFQQFRDRLQSGERDAG